MIRFMVLGAPRSGTTWAANWLMTERTLCLHDPLSAFKVEDLDRVADSYAPKRVGLSCTGCVLYTDWLNTHPAPKVILHRPISEVNASLQRIGFPLMPEWWGGMLDKIAGLHVPWTNLFKDVAARQIAEHLLPGSWDPCRYAQLVAMRVDPRFDRVESSPEAFQALHEDLAAKLAAGL